MNHASLPSKTSSSKLSLVSTTTGSPPLSPLPLNFFFFSLDFLSFDLPEPLEPEPPFSLEFAIY